MPEIKFYNRPAVPMEMHKVKIVQKLNLLPAKERLAKMEEAGFNTFMLHNGDIFMDMLTDSGVNAMSDNMQSAMLRADDAYAGSETFYRMRDKLEEIFGIKYLLPAHQGRACEHIIAQHFVKPGSCVIMNYHFTTSKAHVTRLGGRVEDVDAGVRGHGLVEAGKGLEQEIISVLVAQIVVGDLTHRAFQLHKIWRIRADQVDSFALKEPFVGFRER